MDGSFTLAGLGTLTNSGGTVYIEGTLDNAGGTLNGSSGLGQAVLDGGTVQGGTVDARGSCLFEFRRDAERRDLRRHAQSVRFSAFVSLADGTVVNNAAGTGAGTINDTGAGSEALF